MRVKVISILEDNYMYLVIDEQSKEAIAVDPAVPHRLLEIVNREGVRLTAVLTTHHHWDHARGNDALLKDLPDLRVYGGDDRITGLTHKVTNGQELKFNTINVRCLFTPCHTSGHMCYFLWEDDCPDSPAVFTGDTLFVGGCGKFFEGTAEQMYHNLTKVLGTLPQDTKVFCGHEYTIKNLKFAMLVEPENERVKEKLSWARLVIRHETRMTSRRCRQRYWRNLSTIHSSVSPRRACRSSQGSQTLSRFCVCYEKRRTTSRSPKSASPHMSCSLWNGVCLDQNSLKQSTGLLQCTLTMLKLLTESTTVYC
ncbi:hydroxyacylglutathione hydrolase-like protein isoform X1 [Ictalurus furcatus]|uniref:hydroxyacylglutathione hydrolase-like protein isoform X1 n=1 Tax=Ictalurus furcatus TaxID=66913 RepID=UPI0023504BDA|nr:hydroxyacylglutathione hydrolase-like protein isoform X1 [Ictalurus furcatus]